MYKTAEHMQRSINRSLITDAVNGSFAIIADCNSCRMQCDNSAEAIAVDDAADRANNK